MVRYDVMIQIQYPSYTVSHTQVSTPIIIPFLWPKTRWSFPIAFLLPQPHNTRPFQNTKRSADDDDNCARRVPLASPFPSSCPSSSCAIGPRLSKSKSSNSSASSSSNSSGSETAVAYAPSCFDTSSSAPPLTTATGHSDGSHRR